MVCVVPGGGFDRYFAAAAEEFKEGEPEMPLLVKLGLSMESSFKAVLPFRRILQTDAESSRWHRLLAGVGFRVRYTGLSNCTHSLSATLP